VISIFDTFDILYHLYADDVQVYDIFSLGDAATLETNLSRCLKNMEACIENTEGWMAANRLKFNGDKTEFMVIGTKQMLNKLPQTPTLHIGDSGILASSSAKNIGVVMDKTLSMADHVKAVCKSSYMHLRNISRIRKYLSKDACAIVVHSLVTSRLDNLNALLFGLPDTTTHRLQLIQNHAAKIVLSKKKQDHVTPLLISLHWLPVKYRIQYKILLLTHKCVHGNAPGYLTSLLEKYEPRRALRSADQLLLKEKKMRLKTYGDRAFCACAPRLWNGLPIDLRMCDKENTFKKGLKTYLFKDAFDV
jgi:hypothetical protein